jgi:dihydrofolate reductase
MPKRKTTKRPLLRFRITMSLDGYVAGPNQSRETPLGVGGESLHEWMFPLRVWKAMQGEKGGRRDKSNRVASEMFVNVGAGIMGRNMFGGYPGGPWDMKNPWKGWWGKNPPYHTPVFVLTHYPREPLEMEGGTTFHFVTDGPDAALERARAAAGKKDVLIHGGATVARQYLVRGLIDEMDISVAPMLLGDGERLFAGAGSDMHGMKLVRTVAVPEVVHLKFARR